MSTLVQRHLGRCCVAYVVLLFAVAGSLAVARSAYAEANVSHFEGTITETIPACGDTITVSGAYAVRAQAHPLPNGGSAETFVMTLHDVSGVSTNGVLYRETGGVRSTVVETPGGAFTSTHVEHFRFGTAGGGTAYFVTAVIRFTRNANGDVVVDFLRATAECR